MRTRLSAALIAAGATLAMIALSVPTVAAQFPVPGYEGKNPLGPDHRVINRTTVPRMTDGHPNLSGVWAGPGYAHRVGLNDTDNPGVGRYDQKLFPAFVPGGEALFFQPDTGDVLHDDPTAVCLPDGYPREALTGYATEIIHRIRYIDPMTAEWVQTIDDPKIFKKPFSQTFSNEAASNLDAFGAGMRGEQSMHRRTLHASGCPEGLKVRTPSMTT